MVQITEQQIRDRISKGKNYTMVFLIEGPNRDQSEQEAQEIQMAHLKHLIGLAQQGMLVINGPLRTHPTIRGVSIYNTADREEAVRLASADPAVKAGRLIVEAHEWFGLPGSTLP